MREVIRGKPQFVVRGPFPVDFEKQRGGWTISPEAIRDFWTDHPEIADSHGCYVFGIRSGGGTTPGYVGQAKVSFFRECFTTDKRHKYTQFLANYVKGTPVLFLLETKTRGARGAGDIKDLDDFLIQLGVTRNENLVNIRGTRAIEWGIAGVIRGNGGATIEGRAGVQADDGHPCREPPLKHPADIANIG